MDIEKMDLAVGALRESILGTAKASLGALWQEGTEAALFIEERASRLAFLLAQRAVENDPERRDTIDRDIAIVRTGIDLAEDAELLALKAEGKQLLKTVLDALVEFGKLALPVLLKLAVKRG